MELHVIIGRHDNVLESKSFDHSDSQPRSEQTRKSSDPSESQQWIKRTGKSEHGHVSSNRKGSQRRRTSGQFTEVREKVSAVGVVNNADGDDLWPEDDTEFEYGHEVSDKSGSEDTEDTELYLDRDSEESEGDEQTDIENTVLTDRNGESTNVDTCTAYTERKMDVISVKMNGILTNEDKMAVKNENEVRHPDNLRKQPKHKESMGHECNQCGETFKYRCRLTKHLMKHSGQKPH